MLEPALSRILEVVPEEVREWATRNVSWHQNFRDELPEEQSDCGALHLSKDAGQEGFAAGFEHVILIVPVLPDRTPEYLLLHELAHAWLGHKVSSSSREEEVEREADADNQVGAWLRLALDSGRVDAELVRGCIACLNLRWPHLCHVEPS